MPEPIKETVFTDARGDQAISSYFTNMSDAYVTLSKIQDAMRAAMLEPDVTLATVTKTTTYGDPEPVKA